MKISKKVGLLALGLGVLAVYKYNKMNDDERKALKDKGKKLFDDHISPFLKNALGLSGSEELEEQAASLK